MNAKGVELPTGIHTVALGVADMNGIMRGKRIPASHWPTVCENGNALSLALFTIDMTCDLWETPYVNSENGYPVMHMFPMGTVCSLPWEEGVAFCLGAEGMDHKPVPIDPRNALIKVLERAAAMGYEVNIGGDARNLQPATALGPGGEVLDGERQWAES